MANYKREYPLFSLCGLNCGLCPNHYTKGASCCAGCGGETFFNPACAVVACSLRQGGVEYCFACTEYPCARYEGADESDSFITHRNQLRDNERAKEIGMETYRAVLDEKVAILRELLDMYNDGRRKGFFCTAVNLLELEEVRGVMRQLAAEVGPEHTLKERATAAARLFQAAADGRGIPLKLHKKKK